MVRERLDSLLQQALEAGRRRDYPLAVALLKEILLHSDDHPQALLYLGRSYHALKDYARAIQVFHNYLRVRPSSGPGHFFLGRSYLAGGYIDLAARHLLAAVRSDPDHVPGLSLLGFCLLKAKRPEAALRAFEQALRLAPHHPGVLTGYLNALLTHGIRLYHRGRLPEAAEAFQLVLKHRENSLLAHLYLASIYREMQEPLQALRHNGEAIHLSPADPGLRLQRSFLLLQTRREAEAYRELQEAARLLGAGFQPSADPQESLRLMTFILFRGGRFREALDGARKLLRADYDDGNMHLVAAESLRHLGDLQRARNHYRRALSRGMDSLEVRQRLVEVLWRLKDYPELAEELKRVFALSPDDELGRYYLALSLPHLGRPPERSIPILQDLIRERGPDPLLMGALGQEYLRLGQPDLAEGWLQRALRLDGQQPESLLCLIEVYRLLQREREEGEAFRRYLRCCPGDQEIRRDFIDYLAEMEGHEELVDEIPRLLSTEPHNRKLRHLLALSCRKTGRFGEAVLLYRELLREKPSSVGTLRALACCLEASGQRRAALTLLEKAIRSLGEKNTLLMPLGVLYFQENELEKAANVFRRAIGKAPRDWKPYRNLGIVYLRSGNEAFGRRFLQQAEEIRRRWDESP